MTLTAHHDIGGGGNQNIMLVTWEGRGCQKLYKKGDLIHLQPLTLNKECLTLFSKRTS